MKLKRWTVQDGQVVPCDKFGLNPCYTHAATKGEATRQLLAQLEAIKKFGGPILYYKNGAFCLVNHTGTAVAMESGTFRPDRLMTDGAVLPMCQTSGPENDKTLREKSGWDYYASEEYGRDPDVVALWAEHGVPKQLSMGS